MTCLLLHYELSKHHNWLQCRNLISEDCQKNTNNIMAATFDLTPNNVEINLSRQAPTPCMEERFCHKPSNLKNIYTTQSSENAAAQIFISTFIRRNWSKELSPCLWSNWTDWPTYLWSNWKSKPKVKYWYPLFSISPQELKSQQKTIYTLHYDLYFSKG